jgi:CRISPR/Cas system-associated endoribonuclease Cas2
LQVYENKCFSSKSPAIYNSTVKSKKINARQIFDLLQQVENKVVIDKIAENFEISKSSIYKYRTKFQSYDQKKIATCLDLELKIAAALKKSKAAAAERSALTIVLNSARHMPIVKNPYDVKFSVTSVRSSAWHQNIAVNFCRSDVRCSENALERARNSKYCLNHYYELLGLKHFEAKLEFAKFNRINQRLTKRIELKKIPLAIKKIAAQKIVDEKILSVRSVCKLLRISRDSYTDR